MITINRTAIVVMPGQPFLDWLHRADPTSGELSLEDLRREPTVYLLPHSMVVDLCDDPLLKEEI
jgi:hypothetical protein